MKSSLTLFIKPTCKTCQKITKWLDARGVDYEKFDLFKEELTVEMLKGLFEQANVAPKESLRKNDKMYSEFGLAGKKLTDAEAIRLMVRYPGLIPRPIAKDGRKVAITRRPEEIDAFLSQAAGSTDS